jgi:hypothetical protein
VFFWWEDLKERHHLADPVLYGRIILKWIFNKQPFPVKIMIDQKQLENVESFKYLGSI